MAKKNKTKAEQIASIPIENIIMMSGGDRRTLQRYVSVLRSGYNRRVSSFKRAGVVSHAQIALEAHLPPKSVPLTKMTRNQLILEIARYSKFFNDMTSSMEGIKKVNREQDIRLFGKDSKGRPKHTMSQEERNRFWSLYEEFQNQNPSKFVNYGYNKVQEAITKITLSGNELTRDTLISLMDKISEALEEQYHEENIRSVPNVYSGRGTPFSN